MKVIILAGGLGTRIAEESAVRPKPCLLYTSDAADERSSVDLGGRRIIKKKNNQRRETVTYTENNTKYETYKEKDRRPNNKRE